MRVTVLLGLGGLLGGVAAASPILPAAEIPPEAVVIYASARAGERDAFGLPSDALYVADETGGVTRITYSRFAHNHFSVAPNRRFIAANRYSRGDANGDGRYFPYDDVKELWLIDTVTGEERPIAPGHDAGWGGLAWSPDSQWVYFAGPTEPTVLDVRRVHIGTGEVELLTVRLNQLLGYPEGVSAKSVTDIDVSHDGTLLVFNYRAPEMMAEGMRGGAPKARIGVMAVDGSHARLVSDGGPLPPGRRGVWPVGDFDPDISPDGTRIVFARITDSAWVTPDLSTWDLHVVNADGSGAHSISDADETSAEVIPSWGEGGRIAFSRAEIGDGRRVPYVLDLATLRRTRMDEEGRHVQLIPTARE